MAAEDTRAVATPVAATAGTIPIRGIKEDLPNAAEANTTIKGPRSITTIKGITIKVVTKAVKASTSTTIKDLLKAKAAEVVSAFTPEGGTTSITLKWMLDPTRVPITK